AVARCRRPAGGRGGGAAELFQSHGALAYRERTHQASRVHGKKEAVEMKHPAQATLALHAGGDLGLLARWRTERHVAQCDRCREEVAAFDSLREALPDLTEIPEVP